MCQDSVKIDGGTNATITLPEGAETSNTFETITSAFSLVYQELQSSFYSGEIFDLQLLFIN